jgi:hypothetical protein
MTSVKAPPAMTIGDQGVAPLHGGTVMTKRRTGQRAPVIYGDADTEKIESSTSCP